VREGIELVGLDDLPPDRLQGAGPDAAALGRLLGDPAHGPLRDVQVDAVLLEEVAGGAEDAVPRLGEDLPQQAGVQVLEDDGVVEAGEELRLHAVVEQVLLLEVVAQGEVLADVHLAVLVRRFRGSLTRLVGDVTRWNTWS
jgi:hypothetical protein